MLGHFFPFVLIKPFLGSSGRGTVSAVGALEASLHFTGGETYRVAQRY